MRTDPCEITCYCDEPESRLPSYANFLRRVDKEDRIFNLFGRVMGSAMVALLAVTLWLKLAKAFGVE